MVVGRDTCGLPFTILVVYHLRIDGAKASAVVYSIGETAKANGLNPYGYYEYLLSEIPKHMGDKNLEFLDVLLPWLPTLPERCRMKIENK